MKSPGSLVRATETIHPFRSPFLEGDPLQNIIVPCKPGTMFLVVASDIPALDVKANETLMWTMLWEMGDEQAGHRVDPKLVGEHRALWLASRKVKFADNPVLAEVDEYQRVLEIGH